MDVDLLASLFRQRKHQCQVRSIQNEISELKEEKQQLEAQIIDITQTRHDALEQSRRLRMEIDRLQTSISHKDDDIVRYKNDMLTREAELKSRLTQLKGT